MSGMRRALFLGWRLHRWEIGAVALAAISLSAGATWIAGRLDGIVAGCRAAAVVVAPCSGLTQAGMIYDTATQTQMYVVIQGLAALPFAAGVVLGVPLVAREIEHRTAGVAWPMARSRARWLAIRALPVALLGAALLAIPAMAGEILYRSLYPPIDPAANFEGYGARGPLLLLRFGVAFGASAVVGAVVGRQLPALLLAGVVSTGIGVGLLNVEPLWVEPVEQAQREVWQPIDTVGDLFVRVRYRDADGAWMREEDAWAQLAAAGDDPRGEGLPREVFFGIPREQYLEVVVRESLALVAASAAGFGLLLVAVQRRRPG